MVTNTNGAQVSAMSYLPYGETRSASGTLPTERQFTGQRLDGLSGLHFYNARYYDAGLGRFISPDTIVPETGNPQAWNRYSYVLNNPLRYVDPTGHFTEEDTNRYNTIQHMMSVGAYDFCDDCDMDADLDFVAAYELEMEALAETGHAHRNPTVVVEGITEAKREVAAAKHNRDSAQVDQTVIIYLTPHSLSARLIL